MKRGLKITFLPFVFLAVRVESRFSRNVVLVESSADIVLVFGGKVRFFPVEAVVFSAAEMGYQLAFQRLEILVGSLNKNTTSGKNQKKISHSNTTKRRNALHFSFSSKKSHI